MATEFLISCGQRSGKHGASMRMSALLKSEIEFAQQAERCFLDSTCTEIAMAEYLARDLCQKCNGKRIKRHHRKCAKRGLGHKGREREARLIETRAVEMCNIVVRIRRGRRGKGVAINAATDTILRQIGRRYMHGDPLRQAIVATYGPDAKIDTTEPGTVSITTNRDADPKYVIDGTPCGVRVIVNGVEL
jgi:hypothetical protein